jgi:hypothetical protein
MRLNLLSVMALGLAVTGASCFAAGNASNDAPDLDIGTLVSEGNGIATQQKATDDALKQLSDDDKKLHSDKSELSKKMADYDKSAADFMSRCNHPFVQGQERELAACKDENDQNLQVFKQLSATQKEIPKSLNDWKTTKAKLDQQKADVELKIKSWNHRMKAFMVAKELSSCSNAVAASAGGSDSYAETLRLVSGYQRCWDGALSFMPLSDSAVTQGSPNFASRPARTPEQAIQEYESSGKAGSGVSQKRGLDQANVPSPGSSGR